MQTLREEPRVGLDYLAAVTTLLQRGRHAHPTKGLYEAAELQWWWRIPRPTDTVPQLFWFDQAGRPEAALIVTEWRDRVTLEPIVMPDAPADLVAHIVASGLAHAGEAGYEAVCLEVDRADDVLREVLTSHGFELQADGLVEAWLSADARPDISPLPDDYRLLRRVDTMEAPHHMIERNGPAVESRLQQTSLYRPDLDLAVFDRHDDHAASGLFWFDPANTTGVVEPMRTEDEHQRRGLARHILTSGIELLAQAGAARIKICFEVDNHRARDLYLSVGFEPVKQTDVFAYNR